jgi:hypothetical protein
VRLTQAGDSQGGDFLIRCGKREEACDVGSDWGSIRLHFGGFSAFWAMGYRKLTARPRHHGQKPEDIADFKKASQPAWRKSKGGSPGARQ